MTTFDARRFIRAELVEDGGRYQVGAGDRRQGQRGRVIGIVGLRHAGGYEVVMQMDSGKQDSFAPMQLIPEIA